MEISGFFPAQALEFIRKGSDIVPINKILFGIRSQHPDAPKPLGLLSTRR
jgi:hypothetical protein